ncbi:Rieske (2Fe-2S) protein [Mucilaginibacter lacusdianchii]|uniref:Rieske (2Fe-2S) protein n=1 Tax=Mucilaginibacter lacusdianchii TaxID=2684211 RepID=UPI00131BF0CD|nr:Rieske (2Fe-2S) protein [Mucilaginibacter sp. JXJ CY 39]
MAWFKVDILDDSKASYIQKVKAGSQTICLVKENGNLYALSSKCPHAGADLTQGWCEQGKLICPYHRYSYYLQTGKGSTGQNDYVNTYKTKVRTDGIYVEVLSFWERVSQAFK